MSYPEWDFCPGSVSLSNLATVYKNALVGGAFLSLAVLLCSALSQLLNRCGLKVTWEPPSELDGRPVDRYSIGYGKSMKSLRFITVDKNRRSEVLEDVEPGVLHFLKISAENEEGLSKPVYRAETPGELFVQYVNGTVYVMIHGHVWYPPLFIASESVYVVSLQAQKSLRKSTPTNKAVMTKKPEEVDEAKDVTVRVLSPQSVLITWVDPLVEKQKSIPEGTRHYTVKYREKGESARWEYKETTQRRIIIESLTADGMYEFSIRISQRNQQGKWSASVFQRTPESVPSGPPENFEVKPLRGKGTAVTAKWDAPEEPNGKIREYILSYAPAMRPFGAKSITYRGTTTSVTIDGLIPGDRYIFKIRAVNRKGQGPQSKAFSVAMPGSNRNKELDQEETPTDTPKEDNANEAVEDTQPEITNNVPSKTEQEGPKKVSPEAQETSSVLKSLLPNTQTLPPKSSSPDSLPKTSEGHRYSRIRQPSSRTSGSRLSTQSGVNQESAATRKDYTASSYPKGKDLYNKIGISDTKSSTPSPQETSRETDRGSSSSASTSDVSSSSSSASLPSSTSGTTNHGSGTVSGSVHPTSRRVGISTRVHRLKPATSSQSTAATGSRTSDKSDSQSTSIQDTKDAKESYQLKQKDVESKNNESPPSSHQPTTTNSFSPKEESPQEKETTHEDKSDGSHANTPHLPSRAKPSLIGQGSSPANGNSRIIGRRRQDGRIPLSRTASSVGAGRPIIRGTTAAPTTSPSNGHIHSDSSKTSNDHEDDYIYEGSKEVHNKDVVPTAPPKISVSDPLQTSKDGSQSVPTVLRRPVLGSNERFRSPVIASRLNGSRFPGRLQPVQHARLGSPAKQNNSSSPISTSSSSSASQTMQQPTLSSHRGTGISSNANGRLNVGSDSRLPRRQSPAIESSSGNTAADSKTLSASSHNPVVGSRLPYPSRLDAISRRKTPVSGYKPSYGQGKHNVFHKRLQVWRALHDILWWVLMNEDGKVLQDARGRPRKVVLGEDGKTIFDEQGSPLVNQEGVALFGHGRDSRPVVNPKEKYLTVGGKPVVGLDRPKPSTTTTTTTATTTTTTAATTTTTPEPTTTEMTTLEPTTTEAFPTCPPGTFSRMDKNGFPSMDKDGILDCYPDGDPGLSFRMYLYITDEFWIETTMFPTTTEQPTTTQLTTTIQLPTTTHPDIFENPRPLNNTPSSEFDVSGKKRFTAPYVNYIRKDPGAPCSLTEALEYLQVDVLANLIEKDSLVASQQQPPKHKPHNITVVAMEGCHSFVILDWARPLKDDMVSGYMVHTASYDDVLNNRWSSLLSSGTHLPVENLKPNSRYYFRVQAKNVFGLGPISETLTYVTESDDPLLIERPPGGEPIWIPYTFRYNPAHSSCKGSQFVKRTWYRKFVGVVLCNSLRYKIFMGDGLKDSFYSIGDTFGNGEDHCQFVDSYLEGRTGPHSLSLYLPAAKGYYRSYRQEPVNFGPIGKRTPHPFVGWYECGVPIPGKW
uniref:Fibronectin type-III domain-containing protein n=1 Tax=Pygocentrus nattereri TaxID=42514 RepID=A0AAR2INC6_PYGNA